MKTTQTLAVQPSYKRKIFTNSIWQITSRLVSAAVGIGSAMILTRYLGPTGYGEFNSVIVYVSLFVVIADLGVYQILLRELSQNQADREKILGNVFVWRVISSLITFILAAIVSFALPYRDLIKYLILIECARGFVYAIRAFYVVDFQLKLRMDIASVGDILNRVVFIVLIYFAAKYNLGLLVIFVFIFFSTLVDISWIYYNFKKISGKFKYGFDKKYLKSFLKESVPLGIGGLLGMIHFKGDTFLLSLLKPQADVGIYSASYRVFENLVFLPSVFLGLTFSRLANLAQNNIEDFKSFFQKNLNILIICAIPLTVFFAMYAPEVVKIIAGKQFYGSIYPTKVLAFAIIPIFIACPFLQLFVALKKQMTLVWTTLFIVVLNIILNLIFIPIYSYNGAAVITLITEVIFMTIMVIKAYKLIKYLPKFKLILKLIIPIIITFGFLFLMRLILPFSVFETQRVLVEILELAGIFILTLAIYFGVSVIFNIIPYRFIKEIVRK